MVQGTKTQTEIINPQDKTQTAILVIGGAEDKIHGREILYNFVKRSGGEKAVIGIIPSASREPSLIGHRYLDIFQAMGANTVKVLDVRDRRAGNDPYYKEFIKESTGVFMTGGDQLRLCGLLADTPLMNLIIRRVHKKQITLAGTSAGAAVMGRHMIAGGGSGESPNRSLVDMAMGLGIIPEIIVDQHFYNRNRLARLLSAITFHPNLIGIGIDEDTCAVFTQDNQIEIMGKGTVTIVNPQHMTYSNHSQVQGSQPLSIHNLNLHVLSHGDSYDLKKQQASFPQFNLEGKDSNVTKS